MPSVAASQRAAAIGAQVSCAEIQTSEPWQGSRLSSDLAFAEVRCKIGTPGDLWPVHQRAFFCSCHRGSLRALRRGCQRRTLLPDCHFMSVYDAGRAIGALHRPGASRALPPSPQGQSPSGGARDLRLRTRPMASARRSKMIGLSPAAATGRISAPRSWTRGYVAYG